MGGYQQYHYEIFDFDPEHPLKIIGQPLFDHAAEHGFPPDFFKDSYFHRVIFRDFPEGADCSFSTFVSCSFDNCSINKCVFDNAHISSSSFHSSALRMSYFTNTLLDKAQFRDSSLTSISFQDARLFDCQVMECRMDRVDFQGATLSGDSYMFLQIDAHDILNLHRTAITYGGATDEELRQLRTAIFRQLNVPLFRVKRWPTKGKRRKTHPTERQTL